MLGLHDLDAQLPHGFDKIGPAMMTVYERRSAENLFATAKKYDARYVVAMKHFDPKYDAKLIDTAGDRYFLYDLQK